MSAGPTTILSASQKGRLEALMKELEKENKMHYCISISVFEEPKQGTAFEDIGDFTDRGPVEVTVVDPEFKTLAGRYNTYRDVETKVNDLARIPKDCECGETMIYYPDYCPEYTCSKDYGWKLHGWHIELNNKLVATVAFVK